MGNKDSGTNTARAPWPAVVFLLAGLGLQLSYALKYSDRPVLLIAGSISSFIALLLLLRYNRQRKLK